MNSPLYTLPDENARPRNIRRNSLNSSDKVNPLDNIKSCFSDEDDSQPDQGTDRDILEIAEKQDELKASRDDLVLRMSMCGKPLSEGQDGYNKEGFDIQNKELNTNKPKPTRNESNHFQRQAVNDNDSPCKKGNLEGDKTTPMTPETLADNEGNLDEKLSEEPPRAVMPQNHTVQSISDESKIKPDGNRSVGAIPELKFKGMAKTPALRFPAAGLPIIEGFLKKKSTNMLKLWQRRYYVLKNKKLYYYENEGKEIKAGVLDFDLISVKLETGKDRRKIKIIPVGGSRKFLLKAVDEEEAKKWLDALDKHVKASRGYISSLCKTAKVKRFWKSDRLAPKGFLQQADTGDLLLFKTKNIGARITRSFTFSDYDHVALILRFHTGDIVLFEATGKTGVGLCRWSTFIESKWHLLYSKIVYRKLTIQRSEEVINGIEKFVKYSVGKKYKVSAKKLLKKKVTNNEDENQENRTFFCSELVAACYKKVGLLPQEVSAARYFPGTFAAEKKLQLLNNAKLSDEYLIDFEL